MTEREKEGARTEEPVMWGDTKIVVVMYAQAHGGHFQIRTGACHRLALRRLSRIDGVHWTAEITGPAAVDAADGEPTTICGDAATAQAAVDRLREKLQALKTWMEDAYSGTGIMTHMHCPLGCEHPQPFEGDGKWWCARCWVIDSIHTEMVPCTAEVCG
jgi:hypothetical protein